MKPLHREVLPGIHMIQECGGHRAGIAKAVLAKQAPWYSEGVELHVPQNAYLLVGDRTFLFDTLSPAASDVILRGLDQVLGNRPLDYLALSHPDVPHAGNTSPILRKYPECQLVAPRAGETHALYHLDEAIKVGPDDELDLGGLLLRFPEAKFLDAAVHTWMTEETSKTLFTVDWMGFPHLGNECLSCVDELDVEICVSRLEEFHSRVMFWFQYVDPGKVQEATNALALAFDGYGIASAHGLPIRQNVAPFYAMMNEVVERVSDAGRGGVL